MRLITQHILPESDGLEFAARQLATLIGAETVSNIKGTRYYLDTEDRRLMHADLLFEFDRSRNSGVANLYARKQCFLEPRSQRRTPVSAETIDDHVLRRLVSAHTSDAELIIVGKRKLRSTVMRVRNDDDKIVAWLWLDAFTLKSPSPLSIRMCALRGYDRAVKPLASLLATGLLATHALSTIDPAAIDLARNDYRTDNYPPSLRADDSYGAAIVKILQANFATMEQQEAGIGADLDVEYLHDFRIALRRFRSILATFGKRVPQALSEKIVADLKWLNIATGTRRDLDVYLQHLRAPGGVLKTIGRETLDEMYRIIAGERRKAQHRLMRDLNSARYRSLKAEILDYLDYLEERSHTQQASARVVSGAAIWQDYRRIRRRVNRSDGTMSIENLHTLRKNCKRLRYQIEAFSKLFAKRRVAVVVADLKVLQDVLGAICDNDVQRQFLIERREQFYREVSRPKDFRKTLDKLIKHHEKREKKSLRRVRRDLKRFAAPSVANNYKRLYRAING